MRERPAEDRPDDAATIGTKATRTPMPASVAFREADLVFVGQAHVTPLGRGAQRARFRVEELFRGPSRRVVDIVARGIGGSCDFAFTHGIRYIVFARLRPDGTYASFFCDPSAPLDQVRETLDRSLASVCARRLHLAGAQMMRQWNLESASGSCHPASRSAAARRRGSR